MQHANIFLWPRNNPNWITCATCSCTMHSTAIGARAWINSQCIGIGKAIDRPMPVFDKLIHIGNNIIHTHIKFTLLQVFVIAFVVGLMLM